MDNSERSHDVTTHAAGRKSWRRAILDKVKLTWDTTGRSLVQNVIMAWGLLSLVALPGQWIYSQLSRLQNSRGIGAGRSPQLSW